MSKVKLGKDAVVYYHETEGKGLSDMTLELDVAGVELNLSAGEADITRRSNQGWRQTAATLKDCETTFEIPHDPEDAGYKALRAAFINTTGIAMAIMTGRKGTAGNEGPSGDFAITNFSRSEPIDGAIMINVTAKLTKFKAWEITS